MYYTLLAAASAMFAAQFMFNQKFREECGSDLTASLLFTVYTSLFGFAAMFASGGFRLRISLFSLLMAAACAIVNILYSYMSIKAFSRINLSVYSVFAMLGGMLLPFLYGVIFCAESLTVGKVLCCVMITASLLLTVTGGSGGGGRFYYISVFLLNGLTGVLSAIHQANPNAVGSVDFMVLNKAVTLIACSFVWILTGRHGIRINRRAGACTVFAALLSSFGNLFTLISLKHIPASVQYPVITGGDITLSLIISVIRHENVTFRDYLSAAGACAASVLIIL